MLTILRILIVLLIASNVFAYPITPTGKQLDTFLNSLDVANKWLPNRYVDWKTGNAVGRYQGLMGTHCSTFVAAAANRLGVYILQPPDHDQLLANAQYYWLRSQGAKNGWASVSSHLTAQQIANQGCLVVVAYANPNRHRSGHVAIVRPSTKSKGEIIARGPQIIQAGRNNYNSTALSRGFRNPHTAFQRKKIVYYAHSTPFCRVLML